MIIAIAMPISLDGSLTVVIARFHRLHGAGRRIQVNGRPVLGRAAMRRWGAQVRGVGDVGQLPGLRLLGHTRVLITNRVLLLQRVSGPDRYR